VLTDPDVPSVWQRLGLPGIADIHVHFMPQAMLEKVWHYFDNVESKFGVAWPIQYRTDDATRLRTLDELGVRHFTTLNYAHKPEMARWLNGWSTAFAREHDQAVHSATFYPEPDVLAYTRQAIDDGARVLKVHVQVGRFDPGDELLDPVWGLIAEVGRPVVVHCGSGPEPGHHTGPGPFGEVLKRHPRLTAVIAHAGAPEYEEHLELVERYPNVHLDTTMVGTPYLNSLGDPLGGEIIARYRDLGDRIVFGSDFPNIPYPYATQIESLLGWDCGDDWLRHVLWHNGTTLMGR